MGNAGSAGSGRRRPRGQPSAPQPPPTPPQLEVPGNRYVFAAATPYPGQYTNPQQPGYYPQYPGYYPPPPPYAGPYGQPFGNWVGGQYPCGVVPVPVTPYVEHQKAVTIRNDVNINKESFRIAPDETDPGKFLVSFTFDAAAPGSITIIFFAEETEDCKIVATREDLFKPITVSFEQGLAQKFRQPPGTGVESSMFEDMNLQKDRDVDVYPLVVKAEAHPVNPPDSDGDLNKNSQIIQAVIEKEKSEYRARVVKLILWVNNTRYELQEIYGIGNVVNGDTNGSDPGKECVICLSEPRDTTVLPCRHMCMCSGCAEVLRYQTNRCPICRQPVERLLEIKVNNGANESGQLAANESDLTTIS
ncbi:hypothetical protein MLD38_040159 [Melastoma candidum]|uniref:Uncharacterized protein n=1 Tax=Melastoma candidum TaxID=119954 RepID=A0ACB9L554_9MYRT|nr:hypothetical protein MLD38_040159 [Melastoma candidum]